MSCYTVRLRCSLQCYAPISRTDSNFSVEDEGRKSFHILSIEIHKVSFPFCIKLRDNFISLSFEQSVLFNRKLCQSSLQYFPFGFQVLKLPRLERLAASCHLWAALQYNKALVILCGYKSIILFSNLGGIEWDYERITLFMKCLTSHELHQEPDCQHFDV